MSLEALVLGALFPALHLGLALTASAHALLHKHDPRSAWAWMLACLLIPFFGTLLYLWFGINRTGRRARREIGTPAAPSAPGEHPPLAIAGVDPQEVAELVRIGHAMSGRELLGGNRVTPLHNGEQAYPAMLESIASARHRVWLMSYIFDPGGIGTRFANALQAAQQRGVQVCVLLDGVGDLYLGPRGSSLLRGLGLRVSLFIPPRLFPPLLHINLRNHRKLMCVDGHTAFLGGMNIGDHHLVSIPLIAEARSVRRAQTSDLHFQVQGAVVAQLEQVFAEDWKVSCGERLESSAAAAAPAGEAWCRALTDGPNEDLARLQMTMVGALSNAHRRVQVMTPYFVPTAELSSALTAAALRGVEVSLILPEQTDHPWLDGATRRWLSQLGESALQIFLRPAPFAHSKMFLVDDYYALLGSANLDPRSLRLNFELMLEIYDIELVSRLHEHFGNVREASRRLDVAKLQSRPLGARLLDSASWLFSPYL